jgi:hypothetical protein
MSKDEHSGLRDLVSAIAVCGLVLLAALTVPLWWDGLNVGWDRFKVGYLWHHSPRKVVRAYRKYRLLRGQITKSRWRSCTAYKRWRL